LKNAEYAFSKLKEFYNQNDSSISTSGFATSDILHFYLDSFFAFLYSAFDVVAQVLNQKLKLGIDEDKVSFKSVERKLKQDHPGLTTYYCARRILRSRFFKALDKYRNCSTHRRQIYIQSKTTHVSGTPGYTTSGELFRIERIICDDPLTLNPTVNKNKELITYCSDMLKKIPKRNNNISKIFMR
jgi:hypothetical protein